MKTILFLIAVFTSLEYMNYQLKAKDHSIQGYIEYLKEKYYTKKNDQP